MNKRLVGTIMILISCLLGATGIASAESKDDLVYAEVYVDGVYLEYNGDGYPIIKDGRVMLGIKRIVEALGGTIQWERLKDGSSMVTISEGEKNITLYPRQSDSSIALINGKQVEFDYPIFIMDNYTYVPLRFLSEALGATVNWDNTDKIAYVSHHPIGEPRASGFFHYIENEDGS